MDADTVNEINKSQQQKNKACTNNLKDILDQAKKSIDVNYYENPTVTLATTLQKPTGESNTYV